MSALKLTRTKLGIDSPVCMCDGCNRKGHWRVSLAGYPLLSESRFARGERVVLCDRHRIEWSRAWDELSGERAEVAA